MKFKVGDKIKCIDAGICLIAKGKVYEVVGLDPDGDPIIMNDCSGRLPYLRCHFELYKPEPKPKPKTKLGQYLDII